MYSYKTGLQLHSNYPEYQLDIIANNSDEAWYKAANIYREKYDMSNDDLIHMVLWDETKINDEKIH